MTIVTTARTDDEGRALLDAFGFPFRKEGAPDAPSSPEAFLVSLLGAITQDYFGG